MLSASPRQNKNIITIEIFYFSRTNKDMQLLFEWGKPHKKRR